MSKRKPRLLRWQMIIARENGLSWCCHMRIYPSCLYLARYKLHCKGYEEDKAKEGMGTWWLDELV